MAKNSTKTTDPADIFRRVWVIEERSKSGGKWRINDIFRGDIFEYTVVCKCEELAEYQYGYEYRYRHATLTFDDDGSKCVIY